MRTRRLNQQELESYRHVPRELAEGVRIYEIPRLPGRFVGMTIRNTVILAEHVSEGGDSSLLAHELVHVRQWHELGVAKFLRGYLSSFIVSLARTRAWMDSYRAIPVEVEAREGATRWARSRQGDPTPIDLTEEPSPETDTETTQDPR